MGISTFELGPCGLRMPPLLAVPPLFAPPWVCWRRFSPLWIFWLSGKAWLQSLPGLQVGRGKIVLALTAPTFSPSMPLQLQAQIWGHLGHSPKVGRRLWAEPGRGWGRTWRGPRAGMGVEVARGKEKRWWSPWSDWGLTCLWYALPALQVCFHPLSAPSDKSKTGRKPVLLSLSASVRHNSPDPDSVFPTLGLDSRRSGNCNLAPTQASLAQHSPGPESSSMTVLYL